MDTRPALCLPYVAAAFAAFALLIPPAGAVESPLVDGVPHVISGPAPRDGIHELKLTELWRRGGDDDEEVLLGIVSSARTDPEGNLYVLDSQLNQIMVFDPDGRLLRTLGRQGEGPGEFQNAQRIVFLPGGKALGVAQTFPGKLVGINLDGTPAGDIKISGDPAAGGFGVLIGAELGGDNLVVSGMEIAFNQADMTMNRRHFVRSYSRDGVMKHEYDTKNVRWVFDASFTFREADNDYVWYRMAVDPSGRVFVGIPREEYRITVFSPDGRIERVFGREYQTWPRSSELLARFENMMKAQTQQFPSGTRMETAKYEQDIVGISCQPDGSTWVTTSRGMYTPPPGVFAVWDVFDVDGVFVKQMQARIPGKPGTDLLLVTEHGYAVLITGFWEAVLSAMGTGGDGDDAEPMQIVCYRIES